MQRALIISLFVFVLAFNFVRCDKTIEDLDDDDDVDDDLFLADNKIIEKVTDEFQNQWSDFKNVFHKVYHNEVIEKLRQAIFKQNRDVVVRHNDEYKQGKHTFTMGVNKYSDLQSKTINKKMNGFRRGKRDPTKMMKAANQAIDLPAYVSWREQGVMGPVKDQGQCGSCFTFASTGALEGRYFIAKNQSTPLSEQQLLDCTVWGYGNHGCQGGMMDNCYRYIIRNRGIVTEKSYPYEGDDHWGLFCRYRPRDRYATMSDYVGVPAGDEKALMAAVATGPVSVGIDAGLPSFQQYKDGVYYDPKCSTNLNHAVVVTGYGTTSDGIDYWEVKNSWGTSWGREGYFLLRRGINHCGVSEVASFPVV
jgi:cathepsin L